MKRSPSIAFILSFFLPGLGLWYCGKWLKGMVNFGVALLVGVAFSVALRMTLPWVALLCGVSSGAWAYIVAQEKNSTERSQSDAHD